MFHGDIFLISYRKYIKTKFLISNMHCYELHWTNLKVIFSILEFFCTLRFQIVVSLPNIVLSIQTIHQWTDELVSFQIMCKSQFLKIGT